MTATSNIVITAKDLTGQAFASANSNLNGFASNALKASAALSAIGAGTVVASMAAFTRQTIDAQDNLFKLSQKTGIAVESLAGLEFAAEQSGVELDKVAKATRAFSLLVAESADKSSAAAKKLGQLGLSYKDLKDLSPEKQLLSLADALSKFGKEDRAVALTSLLGNKMADLIPLLAGGSKELAGMIEQGKRLNPVTEQSAKQAEIFNDQLNLLNKSVSAVGREFVQGMIPGLSAVADRMAKVTQESGFLRGALAGVKELFVQSFGNPKILGDVGQIRREIFKTQEVIENLSTKKDSVFFDKNALEHEKDKLAQLQIDLQKAIVTSRDVIAAQDANTQSTKKFAVAVEEVAPKIGKQISAQDALNKAQQESLRLNSEYIKLLNIERQARENLLKPYQQQAQAAEERLATMRQEAQALDLSRTKQISLEKAIELTTIARLEEKRAMSKNVDVTRELDREIAARKQIITVMKNTETSTRNLGNVTSNATDEMSQMWIQAGRNIQSALSNSIFDFFSGGLDNMVSNAKNAVLRIMSEFAALKISQSIGLADMFTAAGGIGGTGAASGGFSGNMGGGLLSAFSAGASGDRLGGFINGGYTANAARASTAGSFFSNTNLGYGALAFGASSAAGTSNITTGIATAMATFGGPYGMLAAAVVIALDILNKKFGDYTISDGLKPVAEATKVVVNPFYGAEFGINQFEKMVGTNFVSKAMPGYFVEKILGLKSPDTLLANALFGRGQFKLQNQQFQANIGADGIQNGALIESYKAKGSAFRSSRTDNIIIDAISGKLLNAFGDVVESGISSVLKPIADFRVDAAHGFTEIINEALSGIGDNMRDVAKNLSIGTSGLDSFSTQLTIISEKGKTITQEDFSTEIARITDEMVLSLFPAITEFANRGETVSAAFARLNTEFLSLSAAAQNLGASVEDSKKIVSGLSIDDRTKVVGQAGGLDKLAASTSFFFANFLSGAERLAVRTDQLNAQLKNIGVSPDITREQYKATILAANTANDLRFALLDLAPAFVEVKNAVLGNSFSDLQKSVETQKKKLLDSYNSSLLVVNKRIADVTNNVQKLTSLNSALKSTLSNIYPISLDEARAKVKDAISSSKSGKVVELESISDALNKLSQSDTNGFSTRNEFLRSQAKSASLVGGLSDATKKQLTVEQRSLDALIANRDRLEKGFNDEMMRLDALVSAAQNEINAINGISTEIKSLVEAIGNFNNAATGAGGSSINVPVAGGNPSITSKDIVGFANTHTPMETYREAIKRGVSSDQIVASGKYTRAEIDKFVKDNKLASFDIGGIVPRTGLALVHKGEQVINPQQKDLIIATLERLIEAVNRTGGASSDTYKLLRNMTDDGLSLKTVAA